MLLSLFLALRGYSGGSAVNLLITSQGFRFFVHPHSRFFLSRRDYESIECRCADAVCNSATLVCTGATRECRP